VNTKERSSIQDWAAVNECGIGNAVFMPQPRLGRSGLKVLGSEYLRDVLTPLRFDFDSVTMYL
jgi:hypothetical protein